MADPTEQIFQESKDLITFGIALLGAGLGVLNYWRSSEKDRVKIRVTPSMYFNEHIEGLSIEVVNIGFVPVTITSVSLEVGRKKDWFYTTPTFTGCNRLPHRLEPRAALTALLPATANHEPRLKETRCAFARTACGLYFRGKSPALRAWKNKIGTA